MTKTKLTKAQLEKAAKNLNEIMEFDPPIITGRKTTASQLEKDLVEAAQEVQPTDELSTDCEKVLVALGVELPGAEEAKAEKPVAAAKPKDEKKPRYSRIDAGAEAIFKLGKDTDVDKLAEEANDLYNTNSPNGKNSPAAAKVDVRYTLAVMGSLKKFKVEL